MDVPSSAKHPGQPLERRGYRRGVWVRVPNVRACCSGNERNSATSHSEVRRIDAFPIQGNPAVRI